MKEKILPRSFNRKLPQEESEGSESQILHFSLNKVANLQVFWYGTFEGR